MRCPDSGLLRSRRPLASKPLRPPWRSRGIDGVSVPAAVAILPPPPWQACWRSKCRDAAISTHTKALERPESCRVEWASYRGVIGERRSGHTSCSSGRSVTLTRRWTTAASLRGSAPHARKIIASVGAHVWRAGRARRSPKPSSPRGQRRPTGNHPIVTLRAGTHTHERTRSRYQLLREPTSVEAA